ncbi:class I poly(R)-hydroxyalkanoic acid synthase [Lichenifustis flavocetrariae]|uniref:Class I poly(R)-hydroxyalkanoic acid synthase n=1 Tax=Lichenifustis flavocetrariae TaxID=2949735 RepID=A0AA41YS56_9HYPH|nr:class I poly(R)-hydroxyalkanoic acid synthase [Lichenifustis flavocetrariae]MCW6507574.1 class I poly(R)-hydroxyalkanoic acid synthase [Lichenifustis flavocetrariae]
MPDFDAMARNMGKLVDFSGKVAAAYLKPRESGEIKPTFGEEAFDGFQMMGKVAESWIANPARMFHAQATLASQLFGLWGDSLARLGGVGRDGTPTTAAPERKTDKRFAAPEWRGTPMFDFLHQAYLATTDWAKTMIEDAEGVDEPTREKAAFYLRQISSALSPANFLATNPELIRETFRENGENLVRGMRMLAEDITAGRGELKIRQSDASQFKLGTDMAATPGKVVFRNDLMELIQYAPTTETVIRRPLLIVPPWINKFYVLDLNKEKSFIGWMVSQGLTVFVISWVNPDERHATKDWDAYMREGIFAALDAIEAAVGEREVTAVGYCVGGTLLAATLAFMAAKGDRRIGSTTLLTTQVDFEHAGDLKVFADEAQIRVIENEMRASGYLPGSKMANAFNMLRPDELIWSYAVNTYLKGKPPAAFDLLAWNADSTRMTAANHAFYLRNCYLENKLTAGEMVLGGERLNLGLVTIPIYDLATKEDHIAPARSVFQGARFFGGPVRYVLAGSGHIAGVVNPPAKAKYGYWTGGEPKGVFDEWLASAKESKGTWWLDWIEWIKAQAPETVPPREPGSGGLEAICDAPGEYVRVAS